MKNLSTVVSKSVVMLLFLLSLACSQGLEPDPCPPISPVAQPTFFAPVWHPSGNYIGFNHLPILEIQFPNGPDCPGVQVHDVERAGFWIVRVDGDSLRRVLPQFIASPTWSPDGDWLAYQSGQKVYKIPSANMEFDTTSVVQLTTEGQAWSLAWSPVGDWIVYDSNSQSSSGLDYVWRMRPDGTEKTRIGLPVSGGATRLPQWSPLADRVVFIHYPGDGTDTPDVYSMTQNGSDWRRLTDNVVWDTFPAYTPLDGSIIYASYLPGEGLPQLYQLKGQTASPTLLSDRPVDIDFGRPFAVSPTGDRLVYIYYSPNDWTTDNGMPWILDLNTGQEWRIPIPH